MASTLVATKLSMPRLRGALVPRPRLTALMDDGAEASGRGGVVDGHVRPPGPDAGQEAHQRLGLLVRPHDDGGAVVAQ